MTEPNPNWPTKQGSKYKATVDVWYTNDGTRIDYTESFSADSISELGYMCIHHWHRHFLQPLVIPKDEYKGFKYDQGKWDVLYAPVIPVTCGKKFYGYYYFWNCRIERYGRFEQDKLTEDEYRLNHINTPRKWWSYDPDSLIYKLTYGEPK